MFSIRATMAIVFWGPILASCTAIAQSLIVDKTTIGGCHLSGYSDPEFSKLLSAHAPGLSNNASAQPLLKEIAVLSNESDKTIVAYQLKWITIGADGKPQTHFSSFAEPHLLITHKPGQGSGIAPKSSKFVGIGFSASPEDFQSLIGNQSKNSSQLETEYQGSVVSLKLDGIIFDDGTFLGPDESDFFARFKASANARHDSGISVLLDIKHGLSDSAILEKLQEQASKRDTYTKSSAYDYYYMQRSIEAQNLAQVLTQFGHDALVRNAKFVASEQRYVLTKP